MASVIGRRIHKKISRRKDEDIISAEVRYHTTGRENMEALLEEKVVYIADYISADRKYPGVERMREKSIPKS